MKPEKSMKFRSESTHVKNIKQTNIFIDTVCSRMTDSQKTGRKNLIFTPSGTHRHRGTVFICKNPPICASDQPCQQHAKDNLGNFELT